MDNITTSEPTPEDFKQVFDHVPEDDILVLNVSSKLSGTIKSAIAAASQSKKNIKILDTLTASVGGGILIHVANKLRQEGKNLQETYNELMKLRDRISVEAVISSLRNLVRLGRLSAVAGFVGNLLKTVPIIKVEDGEVKPLKNERGNAFTIFQKYAEKVLERASRQYPLVMAYTDLTEEIANYAKSKGAYLVQVTPVIGAFVGNNAYGVAYVEGGSG
jgi:DegV family protein with EDD domain